MRLLNTSTLRLEEFHGANIPEYAILSHTWETEEVTFDDLMSNSHKNMVGHIKITNFCVYAAAQNWEYVWIDTCCIDKRSSAELSEAINSMFAWYRDATICYAYLADVENELEPPQRLHSAFRKSKWFIRGWTLQELLAPNEVMFLSSHWKEIGSKSNLNALICQITGINDLNNYMAASVARKLSWMSERITTREEDMAYCLFGLFNINLPLLYGEGRNAFQRLQLEIVARTNDESIFAWNYPEDVIENEMLLAPSPEYFRDSRDIVLYTFVDNRRPWSMTNLGLQIELSLVESDGLFEAKLNCRRAQTSLPVALCLRKGANGRYCRVGLIESSARSKTARREDVIVEHNPPKHLDIVRRCRIGVLLHKGLKAQGITIDESATVYVHLAHATRKHSVPNDTLFESASTHTYPESGPLKITVPEEYLPPNRASLYDSYDHLGWVKVEDHTYIVLLFNVEQYYQIGVMFGHTFRGAWVDIIGGIGDSDIHNWRKEHRLDPNRYFDRISRIVGPGLSVTAALRRSNIQRGTHSSTERRRRLSYYELSVEVGNDELRWPELRNEFLPDPDDSGSVSSMVAEHGQRRWI